MTAFKPFSSFEFIMNHSERSENSLMAFCNPLHAYIKETPSLFRVIEINIMNSVFENFVCFFAHLSTKSEKNTQ